MTEKILEYAKIYYHSSLDKLIRTDNPPSFNDTKLKIDSYKQKEKDQEKKEKQQNEELSDEEENEELSDEEDKPQNKFIEENLKSDNSFEEEDDEEYDEDKV